MLQKKEYKREEKTEQCYNTNSIPIFICNMPLSLRWVFPTIGWSQLIAGYAKGITMIFSQFGFTSNTI